MKTPAIEDFSLVAGREEDFALVEVDKVCAVTSRDHSELKTLVDLPFRQARLDVLAEGDVGALWLNHDFVQTATIPHAPSFFD